LLLATGSTYFTGVIFDDGTFNYKLSPYTYAQDGMVMILGEDENSRIDNSSVSGTNIGGTANGDIVGVAIDMEAGTLKCYKNNVYKFALDMTTSNHWGVPAIVASVQHSNSGAYHIINFGQDSSFAGNKTAQGNQDSNDIGDFYYTPPTGFLALCTKNLPDVDVVPQENFNTVLYSGNGASGHAITGVGFQPDFTWIKGRDVAYDHKLWDAVRGSGIRFETNTTAAEVTSAGLTSFDSDGFTVENNPVNNGSYVYVAWNWKANGSGSSNTDGSITSTVSANVDAGFSILSYTGNGVDNATIGHSLGVKPDLIILKKRSGAEQWGVFLETLGYGSHGLFLESTSAATSLGSGVKSGTNTSTIQLGQDGIVNASSATYIGYAFANVDGYSKVGSYTGNGSTDGTFVYTGFKPAFVMIKNTSGWDWFMHDSAREPNNENDVYLMANSSAAESSTDYAHMDFVSNGFKLRSSSIVGNGSSYNIIYIAFAETPFKYSNAR